MHMRKSALNAMILSAVLVVLALVLAVMGTAPKFVFGAQTTMDYPALFWAIAALAIVFFLFGWLRYDLPGGVAMLAAALHDQLLSLALSTLLSLAFGLSAYLPALLLAGAAATACFTIPTIREARHLVRNTPAKEINRQQIAKQAVANVCLLKITGLIFALLFLIVALVAGNKYMPGMILPLVTGLVSALLSSRFISPYVWAAILPRRKGRS